ncbi:MAG: lamin tail domain-containing protein [Bacteroidia bacterium]
MLRLPHTFKLSSLYLFLLFINLSAQGQLYINEVMTSNDQAYASVAGFVDWVEIYNAGPQAIDLANYSLSDELDRISKGIIGSSNPTQTSVPPGGYLLLFIDELPDLGPNHLDFNLSRAGEMLYLFSPDSSVILDSVCVPLVPVDYSYGRTSDGATSWNAFSQASPLQSNLTGQKQLSKPVFSQKGGVFQVPQTISLTAQAGSQIYYSLDGSAPTANSTLYTSPITIDTTTSLRARAYQATWDSSLIATEAFVFNDSTTLPIVYLSVDPYDFWDADSGIYVKGNSNYQGDCGNGNYHAPWERPVSLHYFDTNGEIGFQLEAGISIFGNCTRNYAMKSLQVATKKAYLSPDVPYSIFPTLEAEEYRRIRLRSGGNHWKTSILGEAISHQLVEGEVSIETQSLSSTIVYINEDYWGIHNMRHNYSEHYFRYKYPQYDTCDFDIIRPQRQHSEYFVGSGTEDSLAAIFTYFENHSPFTQTDYQWAAQRIDLSEWMNYYALQMWLYPGDWPNTFSPTNMIYWRPRIAGGKWRMAVLDTDQGWANKNHNTVDYMLNPSSSSGARNSEKATLLFRRLMEVPDFRNEFVQRYATQLNLLFDANRVNHIIDSCAAIIAPEVPQHTARWGTDGGVASFSAWQTEINKLKSFANDRSTQVFQHLRDAYDLGGTWQLDIPIDSDAHGRVLLNQNQYPAPYQYQGQYLDSIPLLIKASPMAGYRFSHWLETGETTASLSISSQSDLTRTPVFAKARNVVINEIHYNPSQGGEYEFLELYNPDTLAWDLSGYTFANGIDYTFPEGVILNPDSYLLLCRDTSLVTAAPNVWKANWDTGKLSGSERLELQNPLGQTIDEVKYDNESPWPENIEQINGSLQLVDPTTDNALATNWINACPSPGEENLPLCSSPQIIINEINYQDDLIKAGDWIELYNPNSIAVDLSLWQLMDRNGLYQIPAGTILAADAYLVLASDTVILRQYHPDVANLLGPLPFELSSGGESVSLLSADCCVIDVVPMDNQSPWPELSDDEGFSLALLDPSLNNYLPQSWTASNTFGGTPGKANMIDCPSSPVLINEINYRSSSAFDVGDWVELYNPSLLPIDLSGWELHDGNAYFSIPEGTTLASDGYIILAQDPARFQSQFPFVANLVGGWNFGLSGNGERIVILNAKRCWVDEVDYNDSPPWPIEPDGQGPTLALMAPSLDNSLAGSWAPSTWGGTLTGTPGFANQIADPCAANPPSIMITEISYRSATAADPGNWLELYNPSDQSADLSDWLLIDQDSVYSLPGATVLAAKSYLIIAEDVGAFQTQFPSATSPVLGDSKLNFNNGGERLLLYSDSRCLVDSVVYNNSFPWPQTQSGDHGMTIALLGDSLDNALGQNWGLSLNSPGEANVLDCLPWLSVAEPAIWFKASQELPNQSSVPQWDDYSGNGRHALQNTSSKQGLYVQDTLNGNDWLSFDGLSQWYDVANASALLNDSCTIIALHANASGADGGSILSTSEGGFSIGYDAQGHLIYPNKQKISSKAWDTEPVIGSYLYVPSESVKTRLNGNYATSLALKVALNPADSVFIARTKGQASDTIIWLEAECGQRGSKFMSVADANVSNGAYLEIQSGNNDYNAPGDTSKQTHFTFNVSKAGNYRVYGLVRAPTGNDDSFWVRIDNANWAKWNSIQRSSSFIWDQVHDENNSNQAVIFSLSAGEHVLSIACREDGTRLDKIVISNQNLSPAGFGEDANNCNGASAEKFWQGSLAELLVFPKILSEQEIAGVESYLALKYGISVAEPQLLQSPWPLQQGGIGKDLRMCLEQTSSQNIDSTSLLRATAEDLLDQGAYLLWSTNGASLDTSLAQLDVPAGIPKRLPRSWYFQTHHLSTRVSLSIDLNTSNGPITDVNAWQLLVSPDSSFADAEIWQGDSIRLAEGVLEIFGLDFEDDVYLSLGLREYVQISAKVILSGAWDLNSGLMRDDLRQAALIPLVDPYIGERSIRSSRLDNMGNAAIVDWVLLEIRTADDSTVVLWQESLLLGRDGRLMDVRGDSSLILPLESGAYFIALHHRNHLAVMSQTSFSLSESNTVIDFRAMPTYGVEAQKQVSPGLFGLWSGDVNGDGKLSFQGASNDPTSLFVQILSAPANTAFARNYVLDGYNNADVNLDGKVIFQGGGSDTSPIFINVLSHPLNTTFARNYNFNARLP